MFNIKPDIKEIKMKINEDGYCIINNCIEKNIFNFPIELLKSAYKNFLK